MIVLFVLLIMLLAGHDSSSSSSSGGNDEWIRFKKCDSVCGQDPELGPGFCCFGRDWRNWGSGAECRDGRAFCRP